MSANLWTFGNFTGFQNKIWGLNSSGATTDTSGSFAASWIISSLVAYPSVMLESWYICEMGCWKPVNGPPARISSWTPVPLIVPV